MLPGPQASPLTPPGPESQAGCQLTPLHSWPWAPLWPWAKAMAREAGPPGPKPPALPPPRGPQPGSRPPPGTGYITHLCNATWTKEGVHSTLVECTPSKVGGAFHQILRVPLIQNLVPLIHMAENACTAYTKPCTAYSHGRKSVYRIYRSVYRLFSTRKNVYRLFGEVVECNSEKGGGALHTCGMHPRKRGGCITHMWPRGHLGARDSPPPNGALGPCTLGGCPPTPGTSGPLGP